MDENEGQPGKRRDNEDKRHAVALVYPRKGLMRELSPGQPRHDGPERQNAEERRNMIHQRSQEGQCDGAERRGKAGPKQKAGHGDESFRGERRYRGLDSIPRYRVYT